MTNKKVTKIEITSLKTILSGNNLLQLINLQHELVSSFYFNKKAVYHLFVTGQKPNKMQHCEMNKIHLFSKHMLCSTINKG